MRNFLSEEFLGWKISWGKFEICTVDILLCASFSHRGIAPKGCCCWWWQPPLLSFANSENFTFIGNQWWGFLGAICTFIGWTTFFIGWTFFYWVNTFLLGEHFSYWVNTFLIFYYFSEVHSLLETSEAWLQSAVLVPQLFRNKICCKELHTLTPSSRHDVEVLNNVKKISIMHNHQNCLWNM